MIHQRPDRFTAPPTISPTASWYLATTETNRLSAAIHELYALGFRTFVPKLRKWVSHARVRKAVERPLLGRYLFVEIDHPRQSFHTVASVRGVDGLISNPDPLPVPAHWVDSLRMRYMAGEWDFVRTDQARPVFELVKGEDGVWRETIVRFEPNEPLSIGARVRIVEGEFEDQLATITARKGGTMTAKLHGENRYAKNLHACSVRAA